MQQPQEIYDKMACWCETNDKEKTKSIADAEARISDLTTKIEELTASSARLNTEIKNLEKEVAENQAALDKATAIRLRCFSMGPYFAQECLHFLVIRVVSASRQYVAVSYLRRIRD